MIQDLDYQSRKQHLEQIFNQHNPFAKVKPEWVEGIIKATNGIPITAFINACDEISHMNEWPDKNIAAIIRAKFFDTMDLHEKCCPECLQYLDGQPIKDPSGNPLTFYPGQRLYKKSEGTIYQKIGVVTPCTCPASKKFAWMNDPENEPEWHKKIAKVA